MKKTALQICLAIGLVILTVNVSAQVQDSLNTNTHQAMSYNDLGVAALEAGKFDDAIKLLRKAIRLRPDYAIAYGNRVRLSTTKGSLKKPLQL